MTKSASISRKLFLVIALLTTLMCPLLYLSGQFFPQALGFLEPAICPSEMHIDRVTESISDARGNVTASYLVCTDGKEDVDVTGKMLILLFGVAILGVGLLVTWALTGPSKSQEPPQIIFE